MKSARLSERERNRNAFSTIINLTMKSSKGKRQISLVWGRDNGEGILE